MSILLAILFSLFTPDVSDSLRTTDIEEIVIVSTPKENQRLRQQPVSSTSLSQDAMRERGIKGIKDFSATAPNLFIPDYGSNLTTAMYVRGVGSRIGTPAVALYVDGVPQVSAAGYDFNFANVDRVDVLRGPQSTLYGRNSMGGVIRVFTKNPMQYQGTDITLDASHAAGPSRTGHNDVGGIGRYRLNLTHYHRISDRFVEDGTFLRLNFLQLSYSFDPKKLKKWHMSTLSFYASANNLFILTKYKGVDPEVNYGGYGAAVDGGQTPRAKSYTLGVTVDF